MEIRYFDDNCKEITKEQYDYLVKCPSRFIGISTRDKYGPDWFLLLKSVAIKAFDNELTIREQVELDEILEEANKHENL